MRWGGTLVAVLATACGAATQPSDPLSCGERPELNGVCIGVSEAAICSGPTCVDGVECAHVYTPTDEPSLRLAAFDAKPGECIAVPDGAFGELQFRGGVSLLGRGADKVSLGSIAVAHSTGTRSLLRGLTILNGNVGATGAGVLELDRVRVNGGISVRDGSLIVRESTIDRALNGGVSIGCTSECAPGHRSSLTVRSTYFHDVAIVAIAAHAADVDLRDVVIDGVHAKNFQFGRGIELTERATIQGSRLLITRTDDLAMFVDASAGTLGPAVEIRDCNRGVHLGSIPEGGFAFDGFAIRRVGAAAVSIGAASRAVSLRNGLIDATKMLDVPRDVGGVVAVGDGVTWAHDAEVDVAASVTIGGSARVPAAIDATAKGTFMAKLLGGDATMGIVVEHASGPAGHPGLAIAPGTKVVYAP